jgi:hypothetical protein
MNWVQLKENIVGKLILAGILTSPGWIGYSVLTVLSVGENTAAIAVNSKSIGDLAEAVGGMAQLFGNAEVMANGTSLTAAINTHSNAVRFREGQRLLVTNTSDRGQTQITLTVQGKFEGEAHLLLNLSAVAGRALRASTDEIQVAIEPEPEKKAD